MQPKIPTLSGGPLAVLTCLNKATPCGHKSVASGSIPGASPLKPRAASSSQETRNVTVKFRLNREEYQALLKLLPAQSGGRRGLSRFLRDRIFKPRRGQTWQSDPGTLRQLAGFKNHLHLIARQAGRIENPATLVEILVRLASLDREVTRLARGTPAKNPST